MKALNGLAVSGSLSNNGAQVPLVLRTTADVTVSTVVGSYTALGDLAFVIADGATISFRLNVFYSAPAPNSGLAVRLTGSGGMSSLAYLLWGGHSVAGAGGVSHVGFAGSTVALPTDPLTSPGSAGSTVPGLWTIEGAVTAGVTGGTFTLECGPEVADSAPTVRRGSSIVVYA